MRSNLVRRHHIVKQDAAYRSRHLLPPVDEIRASVLVELVEVVALVARPALEAATTRRHIAYL
jgi:hypothetical protein